MQYIAIVFLTISQNVSVNMNATRVLALQKLRKRAITINTSKHRNYAISAIATAKCTVGPTSKKPDSC